MIVSGLDATSFASEASPRFALRAATAAAHERVDALYSQLDLSRSDDYARFLLGHAAALIPIEAALTEGRDEADIAGWTVRPRGERLRADLAALSLVAPPAVTRPILVTEAERLGAIYVLEGSRLGGAVLLRRVATGLPTAFLAPEAVSSWRSFTALLDTRLASPMALAQATRAANAVFSMFEHHARALLEPTLRAD